jgi:uncharacterized membrane protein YoaK (UPF0700 family)
VILWIVIVATANIVALVALVRERDWKSFGQYWLCLAIMSAMTAPAVWLLTR